MAQPSVDTSHLILYDGACGFCRRAMRFVLPRDSGGIFRYASLESETAQRLLADRGIAAGGSDSLFVLPGWGHQPNTVLEKSTAVLFILRHLDWPWNALAALHCMPRRWLDRGYDWVARNRYRWAGHDDSCPVPDAASGGRFLD